MQEISIHDVFNWMLEGGEGEKEETVLPVEKTSDGLIITTDSMRLHVVIENQEERNEEGWKAWSELLESIVQE